MNVIWHKTGLLHDPVTWYKITHAGEQVAQLDFQNKATEVQVVRVALLWKWTSKVRITGWGSFKLLETIRCVLRNIERFQMNLGSLVKDLVRSSNILLFLQVELTDTTIIFRRQRKQTAVTNITTHGLKKITVLLFVMFVTAVCAFSFGNWNYGQGTRMPCYDTSIHLLTASLLIRLLQFQNHIPREAMVVLWEIQSGIKNMIGWKVLHASKIGSWRPISNLTEEFW